MGLMKHCVCPGRHLTVWVPQDLINHVLNLLYEGRPQYFRRVSQGMGTPIPGQHNPQRPIKISETGHFLEYDIRVVEPFVALYPLVDPNHGFDFPAVEEDEFLIRWILRVTLADPTGVFAPPGRWELPALRMGLLCKFKLNGSGADDRFVTFDIRDLDIQGLAPVMLEQALEYLLHRMLQSAFDRLHIPAHYYSEAPFSVAASVPNGGICIAHRELSISLMTNLMTTDL